MATLTEEKYLETVTVLTQAETEAFDGVLDSEPAPVDDALAAAFAGAQQIKAD